MINRTMQMPTIKIMLYQLTNHSQLKTCKSKERESSSVWLLVLLPTMISPTSLLPGKKVQYQLTNNNDMRTRTVIAGNHCVIAGLMTYYHCCHTVQIHIWKSCGRNYQHQAGVVVEGHAVVVAVHSGAPGHPSSMWSYVSCEPGRCTKVATKSIRHF